MTPASAPKTDADLSEQLRSLAKLSQKITMAATDPSALEGVLEALMLEHDWFPRALLFKGDRAGGPFVAISSRGSSSLRRHWTRWPLHRLFVRKQPSRIVDPVLPTEVALAIPFCHGLDRWVVVADIAEAARGPHFESFFTVLESLCVLPARDPENEGPIVDAMAPVVSAFALCNDLHERLRASLERRGWALAHVPHFGALSRSLKQAVPDIIVVDSHVLSRPAEAVTAIHRIVDRGALRLLAFDNGELEQTVCHSLVDRLLPHDADGATMLRAIKELKQESSALRARQYDEDGVLSERRAANIISPRELAQFGARHAAEIVGGWAACFLLDSRGTIYRYESPDRERPIVRTVPKSFLDEAGSYAAHVGDEFLHALTDDPAEHFAIVASGAVSGASIPLISRSGRSRGVLVAFSTEGPVDSQSFRSLENFAHVVTYRFDQLHPIGISIPEFQRDRLWQRLREGTLGLDVYRSADCLTPWHYEVVGDARALLTFGFNESDDTRALYEACADGKPLAGTLERCSGDRPSFAASIDLSTQSMTYATRGFSPPIVGEGSVTVIGASRGIASGTTVLRSSAATICDRTLWAWLQRRRTPVERLTADINEERPLGLASILTLG